MSISGWSPATTEEISALARYRSKTALSRGVMPVAVYVERIFDGEIAAVAMKYVEEGKWERWSFRDLRDKWPEDTCLTWADFLAWTRHLIGDRVYIEVYPKDEDIVNTAPVRWVWVCPDIYAEFSMQFNLRVKP